jgi:hypothetical protein
MSRPPQPPCFNHPSIELCVMFFMNDDSGGIWKAAFVSYFSTVSTHSYRGTEDDKFAEQDSK